MHDSRDAHSYLSSIVGASIRAESSALREWGFDRPSRQSLLASIEKLTRQDALTVCAWLDNHSRDEDVPVALHVEYGVAHVGKLPRPPSGYEPPPIPAGQQEPFGQAAAETLIVDPSLHEEAPVSPVELPAPTFSIPQPYLYHFTDALNLNSILQYGLLSWVQLEARGIEHRPASNSLSRYLDQRRELGDYVRLTMQMKHPMVAKALYERRVESIVWVRVDIAVARWDSTLFSNKNAAASDAVVNSDWRTAFESSDSQAEVLVRGAIHPRWLTFLPRYWEGVSGWPEDPSS